MSAFYKISFNDPALKVAQVTAFLKTYKSLINKKFQQRYVYI